MTSRIAFGFLLMLSIVGCGPSSSSSGDTGDLSVGCSADNMCAAPTPHCDVTSKTCVVCTADAHCPDGTVCTGNQCVAGCSQMRGCGDAGVCDPNTNKCTWCKADSDCSGATPRCDGANGHCVPCLPTNDNCGPGKYCVDLNGTYSCNNGCAKDADCQAVDGGGGAMSQACCNHVCIDTSSDNANCGACGKACAGGTVCCSSACADTTTDVKNCGGCGKACAGGAATFACEASTCALKKCDDGFADCDKNTANGCEVNLNTDPLNCLGCGTTCSVANGKPACSKGCAVGSCDDGYADCDKNYANGCEVALKSDVANCSACGMACPGVPNANSACAAGACVVASCNGNFRDCNNNYGDGCEVDSSKDVSNCGVCAKACGAVANGVPACSGGICGVGQCNGTFADCDGMAGNGCEVNLTNDVANCNACGKACPATPNGVPGCAAGLCGVGSCNVGFANCNGNPNDGCEVRTTDDVKNCGACGKVCPGGMASSPTCVNGVCGTIPCMAPFQECNNNAADGCEANTSNDINNCGACAKVCGAVPNGSAGCANGVCGVGVCMQPFADCDKNAGNGCEVNINTDVNNCGKCAGKCSVANGTPACGNGACSIASCNAGFKDCKNGYADGCETNSTTDVNNCGACGTKCAVANGVAGCGNGACTVASCSNGFLDCKNGYADGCETDGSKDLSNCGGCGKACAAVANGAAGCAAGSCGIASCNMGFLDCDKNAANGCEVNGTSDAKNCGACGTVCGNGACNGGVCKDKVLIVGAPGTANWNNDVQAKLNSTGAFAGVDVLDAHSNTPTLQTLLGYQAVLVYSDQSFADSVTLGNNLADYFDAGGRVVLAVFTTASVSIGGRWSSGNYQLISPVGQKQPAQAAALKILDAQSPLVAGVTTLTATAGYASTGGAINGGVVVAQWGDAATPLIVRGVKNNMAMAALNMYPPSTGVRADFWAGDGAVIMKNALLYRGYCHSIVGKNGGTCASGKTDFCDPNNPIVATTAAQAKMACDACYGISCFLETADCAGAGYGPKPLGMYTANDAYFGYVAGCSGAAGRIWAISASYTTYGRWAP